MRFNIVYRVLSLYGLLAGGAALLIAPDDPRFLLFACGQLALPALLGLPAFMSRPIRLTDPLNLLLLSLLIGTVIGSYMLAFGTSLRRNFVMAEWDVADYATGSTYILIALVFISLGYCMTTRRVPLENLIPRADHVSGTGLRLGLFIGSLISIVALASFVQSSGGLGTIGGKRAITINDGGEVIYAAAGYTRLLASICNALLLMLLGYYLWRYPRLNFRIFVTLVAVFVLSSLLPFLTSGRGAMLQIVIGILFVAASYRQVKLSNLVIAGLLCLVLFSAMTTLRSIAHRGLDRDTIYSSNPIVKVSESGSGLAISSMTAVIDSVPERMPYQMGSTFFTWVFAPIPRSVWPGKPDVSLGKRIKEEIYQQRVLKTGRPTSIMAEGYMNFGWVGFLGTSLAFGMMLRLVANSFKPILTLSPFAPALYYFIATNVVGLANANLSQGIVRTMTDLMTFFIAWVLIRYIVAGRRRGSPDPPGTDRRLGQGPAREQGMYPAE